MLVDLRKDKDEIIRVGKLRHDIARRKGRDPMNQAGRIKTDKDDILGVRGEMAVCRALGLNPADTAIYNTNYNPDQGYDGIYKGWTYEAKGTDHPKGRLMYQPKTHSFIQDIWILAVPLYRSEGGDLDICWDMKMAGWIWREDMPKRWAPCFFDSSAWCINQNQLLAFGKLLKIEPKGKTMQKGLFND